jgi:hypothetical protein
MVNGLTVELVFQDQVLSPVEARFPEAWLPIHWLFEDGLFLCSPASVPMILPA